MIKKTISVRRYFMEPMGSMKKNSIIIKSDKKLKKGDIVECTFKGTHFALLRIVKNITRVKFENLNHKHAWDGGYRHVDLLKHELKCTYPNIHDDTVLFMIRFEKPIKEFQGLKYSEKFKQELQEKIYKFPLISYESQR